MITEKDKNFVYVSGWLKSDYPELYNELIEIRPQQCDPWAT